MFICMLQDISDPGVQLGFWVLRFEPFWKSWFRRKTEKVRMTENLTRIVRFPVTRQDLDDKDDDFGPITPHSFFGCHIRYSTGFRARFARNSRDREEETLQCFPFFWYRLCNLKLYVPMICAQDLHCLVHMSSSRSPINMLAMHPWTQHIVHVQRWGGQLLSDIPTYFIHMFNLHKMPDESRWYMWTCFTHVVKGDPKVGRHYTTIQQQSARHIGGGWATRKTRCEHPDVWGFGDGHDVCYFI